MNKGFNIMGRIRLEVIPKDGLTGEFRTSRSLGVTWSESVIKGAAMLCHLWMLQEFSQVWDLLMGEAKPNPLTNAII